MGFTKTPYIAESEGRKLFDQMSEQEQFDYIRDVKMQDKIEFLSQTTDLFDHDDGEDLKYAVATALTELMFCNVIFVNPRSRWNPEGKRKDPPKAKVILSK